MSRQFVSSLVIVPMLGLCLLPAGCDQKPPPKPVEKKEAKKPQRSPDARFSEERAQWINGQFSEAAAGLAETATDTKIRPLLLDWIQLHEGMALLLIGKDSEAREAFGKIEERGPFPKGSNDPEMADFLVKLAHKLRGTEPIGSDATADYDRFSYQGIALLALGIKDWSLDKYEDAEAFFKLFADVAPEKQVDWAEGPEDLKKLKEMAMNFVNDYEEFAPARKALDDVAEKSVDDQQPVVQQAKAARAKMKLNTKLSKSLDETLSVMGPKVATVMAEREKKSNDETESDAKMMSAAKEKRADFTAKFLFAQAHAAIADPPFKTEKAKDEQELMGKKTQWLANFKSQLIEDLNKSGYSKAVTRKSGELLPGKIIKADEQQVYAGTPAAPVAVPWADISFDSDIEMAKSFIQPDMPPAISSFRKWHLGVFAFFAGKTKDGLDLLRDAAGLRPVFKDELPLFEKPSEPY